MIEKFSRMKFIADEHKVNLVNPNILQIKLERVDANTFLNDIEIESYKSVGIGVNLDPKSIKNGDITVIFLHNVGDLEDISSPDGVTYYEKLIRSIEQAIVPRSTSSVFMAASSVDDKKKTMSAEDMEALKALQFNPSDAQPETPAEPTAPADFPSDENIQKTMETAMNQWGMIMVGNAVLDQYPNVDREKLLVKVKEISEAKGNWEYNENTMMVLPKR